MELCPGTIQLGMDYRIAGGKQPDLADAFSILEYIIKYIDIGLYLLISILNTVVFRREFGCAIV